MAWDLILWFTLFFINLALMASTLFQIICLSDLEADYINPYELSSRINILVVPEFILQGVFSLLFLLTWHWFMFLITVPINYYNIMLYIKRKHLIDVTEIFSNLNREKRIRIFKIGFYVILFSIVMIRIFSGGLITVYDSDFEGLDISSSILEF